MAKQRVDTQWARAQLEAAKVPDHLHESVIGLLEAWENTSAEPGDIVTVLETFVVLAQGHGLRPAESEEVWVQVIRGMVHTGDIVRVRHNAFEGSIGQYHNGRRGKVTGVRSGDIIFRSNDGLLPDIDGARYHPDALERKVESA